MTRKKLLLGVFVVILIGLVTSVTIASADDSGTDGTGVEFGSSGSGGGCLYTDTSGEEFSEPPPVCSGVVTV